MTTMQMLGVGYRAARQAARERRAQAGVHTRSKVLTAVAEHFLTILAGGCFAAAGAMVAIPLGLAIAGVALLALEAQVGE